MTIAVCLVCGAQKVGAFNPCARCCWVPVGDEDRVRSMMVSDHYHPADQLAEWGKALSTGVELGLPENVVARLMAETAGAMASMRSLIDLPIAPVESSARQVQDGLAPIQAKLGSLTESRKRYLHVLTHRRALNSDELSLAQKLILRLEQSDHETNTAWLVRFLCLAFAPNVSMTALEALGRSAGEISAGLIVQRLLSLPKQVHHAHMALTGLAAVIQGNVSFLHESQRMLSEALQKQSSES